MSRRVMIGVFEREEDTVRAVRASRSQGLQVVDVYGPYPIHGLDRILGLQPSKLPWVCFLLGVLGASLKVWFEFWTTASSWPINVGGKPWNSLPAFVPVTFEVMVLFAGVSTVLAFFLARRLFPGRRAVLPVPRVTDDRFAVILEETDATFDSAEVRAMLEGFRAVEVEERTEEVER